MIFDYEPGDYVINPKNKEWGTGQIQSIIKNVVTGASFFLSCPKIDLHFCAKLF